MQDLDLKRYLGTWYEIAKKPFPMEKDCNFAEAHYTWDSEQQVMLIRNTCLDENRKVKRESFGRARVADSNNKSKLKVKFSGPDAWTGEGDYVVLYTDYDKYSIVGGGPFLWILSRKQKIPKEDVPILLNKVKSFDYDPNKLLSNRRLLY